MMAALMVALWFCRADTIDQDGPKPVRLVRDGELPGPDSRETRPASAVGCRRSG
jgi:hypothetical protein